MNMDEQSQSRRTNILVGNEILTQIDDSQNVTHTNGVMKIDVTKLPNPAKIGVHALRSAQDGAGTFFMLDGPGNASAQIATKDDLADYAKKTDLAGVAVTWENLQGKPVEMRLTDGILELSPDHGATWVPTLRVGQLCIYDDRDQAYDVRLRATTTASTSVSPFEWSNDGGQTWSDYFTPEPHHSHAWADLGNSRLENAEPEIMADMMGGAMALFPISTYLPSGWEACDGGTILRNTPAGDVLAATTPPFRYGAGDGSTTCNKPTLTAPDGFGYYIYVGTYNF